MIMLFGADASSWEGVPPERIAEIQQYMGRMDQELRERGEHVDGQALADGASATAVVLREGRAVATDGPFAEPKEALIGYWVVDVESEERAVEIATGAVSVTGKPMEVRPIVTHSGP